MIVTGSRDGATMALSEQDRAILSEMELGLRTRAAHGAGLFQEKKPPSLRSVIGAIGLVVGGLAATAIGLALQDWFGDGVSVLGFVLIVMAARVMARPASYLCRQRPPRRTPDNRDRRTLT
jgi:hypothetical protein